MVKQLKYDMKKVFFQKKYLCIPLVVLVLSLIYGCLCSYHGDASYKVVNNGFMMFRQLYWLLCCYIICDIVTDDYRYSMLKNVIPSVNSRTCYIISKIGVSIAWCFLILFIHILTTNLITFLFAFDHHWIVSVHQLVVLCVGGIFGVFIFEGLFILCMVAFENEAITIGFSIGFIFIMMVLENIDIIAKYVPTMWITSLLSSNHLLFKIISVCIVMSGLCLTISNNIFTNKDVFI